MNRIFLIIASLITFTSCEKVIDLNLKDAESRLVIQGNITNEAGPYYVKLSKSVPVDKSSNYPAVTDAKVVIEDDKGINDSLTPSGNGVYETNMLEGAAGRTYHLTVVAEGETYTASSTMPQAVWLDSISITTITFGSKETILLVPGYTDPADAGNNYKFNLFVNGIKDKSYLVWNDTNLNGEVNERPLRTTDLSVESGDTARIEMESINSFDYNYYYILSQMGFKGPGGGTTPTNPQTNLSNGALGLFSAHTISE